MDKVKEDLIRAIFEYPDIMTHPELIEVGEKLLKSKNYPIILSEIKSSSSEIPDVIGFKADHTTVLECKTSRADFLADKKKKHIRVGNYRFFICPKELIKPQDLPENYGLIYVDEKRKTEIIVNPYCKNLNGNIWSNGFESNIKTERQLLFTYIKKK